MITRNSDWFLALFAPIVIGITVGRSNQFEIGFSTVISKPLKMVGWCFAACAVKLRSSSVSKRACRLQGACSLSPKQAMLLVGKNVHQNSKFSWS